MTGSANLHIGGVFALGAVLISLIAVFSTGCILCFHLSQSVLCLIGCGAGYNLSVAVLAPGIASVAFLGAGCVLCIPNLGIQVTGSIDCTVFYLVADGALAVLGASFSTGSLRICGPAAVLVAADFRVLYTAASIYLPVVRLVRRILGSSRAMIFETELEVIILNRALLRACANTDRAAQIRIPAYSTVIYNSDEQFSIIINIKGCAHCLDLDRMLNAFCNRHALKGSDQNRLGCAAFIRDHLIQRQSTSGTIVVSGNGQKVTGITQRCFIQSQVDPGSDGTAAGYSLRSKSCEFGLKRKVGNLGCIVQRAGRIHRTYVSKGRIRGAGAASNGQFAVRYGHIALFVLSDDGIPYITAVPEAGGTGLGMGCGKVVSKQVALRSAGSSGEIDRDQNHRDGQNHRNYPACTHAYHLFNGWFTHANTSFS